MERTQNKQLKNPLSTCKKILPISKKLLSNFKQLLSIYINKNYSNNKISSNNTYCCIIKERNYTTKEQYYERI